MKRRISPVLIVLLLIILVAIAGGLSLVISRYLPGKEKMDSNQYFGLSEDDEAALILDQDILEAKGRLIDGEIYIDEDTVSRYINSRFYWDEQNQEMLYTLPEEILELEPGSSSYTEGGEKQEEEHPIIVEDGEKFFVSLDFLIRYTDMNCQVFENPNRVVINTQEGAVQMVDADKDYQVREKGGIKSPILTEGVEGDHLRYLEGMENWTKVATQDGYVGYVRNKDLSEVREEDVEFTSEAPEYTSIQKDYKINLSWHLMTNEAGNQELADKIAGCTGLNTISPTWFTFADSNGTLTSLASREYVDQAHAAGLEVWGLIENINTDVDTYDVLSVRKNRENIISQLMSALDETGMDGINVDFENISEDSAPHYVQFVRELSVAMREAEKVLSVDLPVPQPYNEFYNLKEQGIMADYVIIMGYDEHYAGSEEAGSVASLPYVEAGIQGALEDVPKEKVINAIPFYTRLWTQPFGSSNITSETMTMDEASEYVKDNDMEVYWDGSLGQNVAEKEDNTALYQIWLEDEESIEEKMKLIRSYELAGVASWQLGYQRNTVWKIMDQYLNE
ncbi:MAG: glycosyl hydrolase family 18 protein [Ruminococcus sp.]|jgi:spore germination protein YaaH